MNVPRTSRSLIPALGSLLVFVVALAAEAQEKRPLDHEDYDRWNRIQQQSLSRDGRWLQYRLVPGEGDGLLRVLEVDGDAVFEVDRGRDAVFSRDARFVVFRIEPSEDETEEEDDAESDGNGEPQDSLGILDLSSGDIQRLDRLQAFTLGEEADEWLVIHREALPHEDEAGEEAAEEAEAEPTEEEAGGEESEDRDKEEGTPVHYRNLRTGEERIFPHVTSYRVTDDGAGLLYAASSEDGEADGVFWVEAGQEDVRTLSAGEGAYLGVTLDEQGEQAAFLTNRDAWEEEEPEHALYRAVLDGTGEARRAAAAGDPGIPVGWIVSEHGDLAFSDDGTRLFFGTAPGREPEPEDGDELLENVKLDVWSWHDGLLQSHQLNDLERERERTYEAVLHLDESRIVQLADASLRSVSLPEGRDGGVALGEDELPYQQRISWDTRFADLYVVDVGTGERELVAEDIRRGGSISPAGRYVYWWDGSDARDWMVLDVASREVVNVTESLPHPVWNEQYDRTGPPSSYGLAGWTEDDAWLVVQDRYDLWAVDPHGREEPWSLTAEYGRANDVRLRIVRLDWEDPEIPLDQEVLLSAFEPATKAAGYYRTRFDRNAPPERLVLEGVRYAALSSGKDTDRLLFTKSTFEDFPDLWVSDERFQDQRRLTEANPQQAEYTWGTAELVTWTSAEGEELQGILYKPENFDPSEEWPMMVYFYERSSDGLHGHFPPGAATSINRTFYVSRGYLLFVPDIPYKAGYPGQSAMNAVVPGVTALVDEGFVDRHRIGVQGHSWGGYQISYMVTRTNLFAAAEAGAPVSNMTSAYGGIRWSSGLVRQMQYETGQSRIGGTLWDAQHRYIENSPLFTAYQVETPLLILHNDEDGAVPWQQGIEFFVALRRLGKPSWLINYNGQDHGVAGEHPQKDWAIRMQQFFDHYLKGAPPPVWMVHGVPAIAKGKTLGLELVTEEDVTDASVDGDDPDR